MFDALPPPKPALWLPSRPAIIRAMSKDDMKAIKAMPLLTTIAGASAGALKSKGAGLTPASISFITNAASSSGLTNYTFSTQSIGTAATGRRIIVVASGYSTTGGRTFSSVTIGGNAATSVVTASDSGGVVNSQLAGIFILQVDAGTTADIVVNFSGGMGGCDIGVFAAYDLLSSTATDTGSSVANPMTDTIDISAGGICVAGCETYTTGSSGHTWTNLTERYDATQQSQLYYTGASDAFASSQTALAVTCTPASYTSAPWVIASFR